MALKPALLGLADPGKFVICVLEGREVPLRSLCGKTLVSQEGGIAVHQVLS